MTQIRCAWGHSHATVAEVRACAARQQQLGLDPDVDEDGLRDDGAPDGSWDEGSYESEGPDSGTVPPGQPAPAGHADHAAGPDWLGRDALVAPGQDAPSSWRDAPRVVVDAAFLTRLRSEPFAVLDPLWARRHARQRTVFELDPDVDLQPDVVTGPVWTHAPDLILAGDALDWLITSNAVDLRSGAPRWEWAHRAVAAGARWGGPADVVLPDGTPAWCDGGPPRRFAASVAGGDAVVHRAAIERRDLRPFTAGPGGADRDDVLAPDQLAAVHHDSGAARIIAPAGSGKTRVLTERARHLLTSWQVPPTALCLVAFNTRAADEIRARTTDLRGLHVRTLNALGLAILNGDAPFARRGDRYGVITESDVRELLDRLVKPTRTAGTDPLATWMTALSDVRLRLRDPGDVEADYGGDVDGLTELVPRYRELLADRHALDFDEQIVSAIEVLLREPETRAEAQRACRFLLVDEFQDLAPAHLLLVRLLGGPELSVFGVGDDDQTIYGFSGATPRWLIGYRELFPGAGDHPLTVNYRCPAAVVTAADTLLRHNTRRVPKEIHAAAAAAPGGFEIRRCEQPAADTVDVVAARLHAGAAPEDVAVLARVNSVLLGPQIELRRRGIPVVNAVRASWLQQRAGVRAAMAWLRLAADPGRLRRDDIDEAARRPSNGRSRTLVGWMAEQRDVGGLRALAGRLKSARDTEKVDSFTGLLERLAALADGSTDGLVATLAELRQAGLDETLGVLDGYRHDATRSAHLDDLDTLMELARICPEPDRFPQWLRSELERPDDPSGVRLSTVHRVKGLEWPHVVVHDASGALFPHRLTSGIEELEEERRIFHVAITRASVSCTVVAPRDDPSPFVDEVEGRSPTITLAAPPPKRGDARTSGKGQRDRAGKEAGGPPTALEGALRAWRTEQAKREGKPAYVIFHDTTLGEIAARRPATLRALAMISGIGPAKLERYGDDILAVVAATS